MGCFGTSEPVICVVELLDDTEIKVTLKHKSNGQALMDGVCSHLNLLEKDYFGLRLIDKAKNYHWLDLSKSIVKQNKRYGLGQPDIKFYFGVKFYAADPCKLKEEITRYQFFLQVKRDILNGRIPVSFDHLAELCALAVQSELGDFDKDIHTPGYVSELVLASQQSEELEQAITECHQKLNGFLPSACEYMYLDKIKWQEMYGVDLHRVKGDKNTEYFIGLTPSGVVIFRHKTKVGTYYWPRITGLNFRKNEFSLRVKDKTNMETNYSFNFESREACKHLWKCCVEHHSFFRLTQAETNSFDFFNLGSKFRYSGRTEKQLAIQEPVRCPPNVHRTCSQRQQRRRTVTSTTSHTQPIKEEKKENVSIMLVPPLNVTLTSQMINGNDTTTNTSSQLDASWLSQRGLFTSGRDSPKSTRSEKMKFPTKVSRNDSCSETDSFSRKRLESPGDSPKGLPMSAFQGYHHRRESDNESERSGQSRRRRRRYQRGYESGSDAESMHRRRRHSDHHKSSHSQNRTDSLIDQGSVCSGLSTPTGTPISTRSRRRSQRNGLLVKGLAPEMRAHLKFELIDTVGMNGDQLHDIPYTEISTTPNPDRQSRASPSHSQRSNRSKRSNHSHHHHHHHRHYAQSEKSHSSNHNGYLNNHPSKAGYENISYDKSGSPRVAQSSYDSDTTIDQEIAQLLKIGNDSHSDRRNSHKVHKRLRPQDLQSERDPCLAMNGGTLIQANSLNGIKKQAFDVQLNNDLNRSKVGQKQSQVGDYSNLDDFRSLLQQQHAEHQRNGDHISQSKEVNTLDIALGFNGGTGTDAHNSPTKMYANHGLIEPKPIYKQTAHRDPPHLVKTNTVSTNGGHHSPALHINNKAYRNSSEAMAHRHILKVSQI